MKECDNPRFKTKIPYLLVFKQIEYESGWRQKIAIPNKDEHGKIVSYDYGMMQINSTNIKKFIHDYKDPDRSEKSYDVVNNAFDNVQIGIRHLRHMYEQFDCWKYALTAYNAGPDNVSKELKPVTKRYLAYIIPIDEWWKFPETVVILRKKSA
jgi:soluble lytic murein transglycosylase-like protein